MILECFILPVGPNYITRRSRNATILLAFFFFLHFLPLPFLLLLCFICILAILIKKPSQSCILLRTTHHSTPDVLTHTLTLWWSLAFRHKMTFRFGTALLLSFLHFIRYNTMSKAKKRNVSKHWHSRIIRVCWRLCKDTRGCVRDWK